jgi:hypothetical protein
MDVDLQEQNQPDTARQRVAKVKARARPWRAIFALVLAVVAASVSTQARHTADELAAPPRVSTAPHVSNALLASLGRQPNLALEYGAAVAFFLLAGIATIGLGNKARQVLQYSVGSAHAAVIRFAVLVLGGLCTIVVTLDLLNIEVTQLLLGGALTGVVVGIAAQQTLGNMFAGMVLLMARPFQVGDQVGIRAGALSGLIEGTVTEISVTYVKLQTSSGPVHIPNSQVLAAAVGPAGAVPAPPGQSPSPASAAAAGQEMPARRARAAGQPGHASWRRRHPAGEDSPPSEPGPAPPGTPVTLATPAELAAGEDGRLSGAAAPAAPAAPATPAAPPEAAQPDPAGPETQRDDGGRPS